jgi:hypothetical protein
VKRTTYRYHGDEFALMRWVESVAICPVQVVFDMGRATFCGAPNGQREANHGDLVTMRDDGVFVVSRN